MHNMPMLAIVRGLVVTLLLLSLCGCFDPPLGEVGMKITQGGEDQPKSCLVQVFNAEGRQIQEVPTDRVGVCYIKRLSPGVYTFKFKGGDGNMFDAVRTVTVGPGASCYLPVDLNKKSDPKAEAEASTSGNQSAGGGEYNMEP